MSIGRGSCWIAGMTPEDLKARTKTVAGSRRADPDPCPFTGRPINTL